MTSRKTAHIEWGHVALLILLAVATLWYLHDAWTAAPRVRNLILIVPASILSLILVVGVFGGVVYRALTSGPIEEEVDDPPAIRERIYPFILMGVFALYILTLPTLGFDVGSALFILIALLVDGERRLLFLILYAAIFAGICTLLFRWLLPYPMPTLIL